MAYGFLDIAVTPSVKAVQTDLGVEGLWSDFKGRREFDRFTDSEKAFIKARDSFYLASVSETGWPYVQHRGGTKGFLKVIDDRNLAFADYRGNRQYISTGNFAANDRACLILMDYPNRSRLKIYARVTQRALHDDPALTKCVTEGNGGAGIERLFCLELQNFDWNCRQHITPRYTESEIKAATDPLYERLQRLEAENAELRAVCAKATSSHHEP